MQQLSTNQVITYAQRRAILETALAQRLYSVFDSPPLLGRLRDFVCQGIEHLAVLATRGAPANAADAPRVTLEKRIIEHVFHEERFLGVWRHAGRSGPGPRGLCNVVNNRNKWTAGDCSDLIRLYATVMENDHLRNPQVGLVGADVAAHQGSTRPAGGYFDTSEQGDRQRGGRNTPIGAAVYHPHSDAARSAVGQSAWSAPQGGIFRYRLLHTSNVRRIDAVFGLPEGADISGTTSDSMFFMEHVNSYFEAVGQSCTFDANWLPVIQLLPLVTMVSQGHHTLLESALSLTLNENMTYSVGFYSTLMPHWSSWTDTTVTLGQWMLWAEDHEWNYHMLCYYDEGHLCGYLFGRDANRMVEQERFKRLAKTGRRFLDYFRSWPAMPRQIHVDTLRAAYSL